MVGQREPNVIPGFGITLGFTTFFLCAIVLIPLAALVLKAGGMEWERFVGVITSPRAIASYKLSFGASLRLQDSSLTMLTPKRRDLRKMDAALWRR